MDYIIVPTLKKMGSRYDSANARMLLLATAAIESRCGYYIKQVKGPAEGIWQMEPATTADIFKECDALRDREFLNLIRSLKVRSATKYPMVDSPMYACAMARLKYAMDPQPLPDHRYRHEVWEYYKRIYNTIHGASTISKFFSAWDDSCTHIKL